MTDPELQRLYEAIKGTNRFKSDPSLRGMTAALVKLGKISDTASAGDVRQSEGHDSRKAAADSAAEDAWIKTRDSMKTSFLDSPESIRYLDPNRPQFSDAAKGKKLTQGLTSTVADNVLPTAMGLLGGGAGGMLGGAGGALLGAVGLGGGTAYLQNQAMKKLLTEKEYSDNEEAKAWYRKNSPTGSFTAGMLPQILMQPTSIATGLLERLTAGGIGGATDLALQAGQHVLPKSIGGGEPIDYGRAGEQALGQALFAGRNNWMGQGLHNAGEAAGNAISKAALGRSKPIVATTYGPKSWDNINDKNTDAGLGSTGPLRQGSIATTPDIGAALKKSGVKPRDKVLVDVKGKDGKTRTVEAFWDDVTSSKLRGRVDFYGKDGPSPHDGSEVLSIRKATDPAQGPPRPYIRGFNPDLPMGQNHDNQSAIQQARDTLGPYSMLGDSLDSMQKAARSYHWLDPDAKASFDNDLASLNRSLGSQIPKPLTHQDFGIGDSRPSLSGLGRPMGPNYDNANVPRPISGGDGSTITKETVGSVPWMTRRAENQRAGAKVAPYDLMLGLQDEAPHYNSMTPEDRSVFDEQISALNQILGPQLSKPLTHQDFGIDVNAAPQRQGGVRGIGSIYDRAPVPNTQRLFTVPPQDGGTQLPDFFPRQNDMETSPGDRFVRTQVPPPRNPVYPAPEGDTGVTADPLSPGRVDEFNSRSTRANPPSPIVPREKQYLTERTDPQPGTAVYDSDGNQMVFQGRNHKTGQVSLTHPETGRRVSISPESYQSRFSTKNPVTTPPDAIDSMLSQPTAPRRETPQTSPDAIASMLGDERPSRDAESQALSDSVTGKQKPEVQRWIDANTGLFQSREEALKHARNITSKLYSYKGAELREKTAEIRATLEIAKTLPSAKQVEPTTPPAPKTDGRATTSQKASDVPAATEAPKPKSKPKKAQEAPAAPEEGPVPPSEAVTPTERPSGLVGANRETPVPVPEPKPIKPKKRKAETPTQEDAPGIELDAGNGRTPAENAKQKELAKALEAVARGLSDKDLAERINDSEGDAHLSGMGAILKAEAARRKAPPDKAPAANVGTTGSADVSSAVETGKKTKAQLEKEYSNIAERTAKKDREAAESRVGVKTTQEQLSAAEGAIDKNVSQGSMTSTLRDSSKAKDLLVRYLKAKNKALVEAGVSSRADRKRIIQKLAKGDDDFEPGEDPSEPDGYYAKPNVARHASEAEPSLTAGEYDAIIDDVGMPKGQTPGPELPPDEGVGHTGDPTPIQRGSTVGVWQKDPQGKPVLKGRFEVAGRTKDGRVVTFNEETASSVRLGSESSPAKTVWPKDTIFNHETPPAESQLTRKVIDLSTPEKGAATHLVHSIGEDGKDAVALRSRHGEADVPVATVRKMKTAYAKAKAAGASEEDIHLMLESMAKSSGITPGEGSIVKVPLEDGRTWTLAVRGKAPNGGTPGRDVELSQPDWLEHVPFPKQGENFPKSPEMGQMDTLVSYGDDSKKSTSDAISNLTGNDKAEVSPEGLKAKDPRKIVQDGPSVSVPLASGGSAKLFLGAKVRGKFYRGTGNAAETEQNHVIVPMRVVESHADGSLSARVLETSQIRLSNNGLKEPLYLQKGTLLRIGKGHDMGFDNIVSMETHLQEYHPKYNKNPKMTTLFDAPTKGVSESLPKAKGGAKLLSDKLKAMPGEEASSISDAGKRISYSSEKLRAAMEELDRLKKEGC